MNNLSDKAYEQTKIRPMAHSKLAEKLRFIFIKCEKILSKKWSSPLAIYFINTRAINYIVLEKPTQVPSATFLGLSVACFHLEIESLHYNCFVSFLHTPTRPGQAIVSSENIWALLANCCKYMPQNTSQNFTDRGARSSPDNDNESERYKTAAPSA